jgi:hypothetical protein
MHTRRRLISPRAIRGAIIDVTPQYTLEEARAAGTSVGVDWATCGFSDRAFQAGMCVEYERAVRSPDLDPNDALAAATRAQANLFEFPDYYTPEDMLEAAYDEYWSERGI